MNTEFKASKRTKTVLTILHVLVWIVFIGLCIEAGAIIISYGVSLFNPEAAKNLYKGWNLYPLEQYSFGHYTVAVSFMVAVLCMKAFIAYLVIKAVWKRSIDNPFQLEVSRILERISYILVLVSILSILHNAHASWLMKRAGISLDKWALDDIFFMTGLTFVISQIFKRGVQIQTENELTV